MGDRRSLINAIQGNPDDDTPRLIFADWLDEFGKSDQDYARAEYIRLSCGVGYGGDQMRSKVRLGVKEGKWLDANWKRLLPSLLASAAPECWEKRLPLMEGGLVDHTAGGIKASRSGRNLTVRFYWGWDSGRKNDPKRYSGFTMHLWFWRGFLRSFDVYTVRQLYLVGGIIAADDPLAVPKLQTTPIIWERRNAQMVGTVRSDHVGPLFPFLKDFDTHYSEYGTVDGGHSRLQGLMFEPRRFKGETEEQAFARADNAIESAAGEWIRSNEGASFHNSRTNYQVPNYRPVKLPINAMTDYEQELRNLNWGGVS